MLSVIKPTFIIDQLMQASDHLTVSRVINTLAYALKSSEETVVVAGRKIQLYELGAQSDIGNTLARTLKIVFYGGPPGQYTRHEGCLLMLLCDRLAWDSVHGAAVLELLERLVGHSIHPRISQWVTLV